MVSKCGLQALYLDKWTDAKCVSFPPGSNFQTLNQALTVALWCNKAMVLPHRPYLFPIKSISLMGARLKVFLAPRPWPTDSTWDIDFAVSAEQAGISRCIYIGHQKTIEVKQGFLNFVGSTRTVLDGEPRASGIGIDSRQFLYRKDGGNTKFCDKLCDPCRDHTQQN